MNASTAAIVLFVGVIVIFLVAKGRIKPVWDAWLTGNIQETGSQRTAP